MSVGLVYKTFNRSELSAIGGELSVRLKQWAGDWFGDTFVGVHVENAAEVSPEIIGSHADLEQALITQQRDLQIETDWLAIRDIGVFQRAFVESMLVSERKRLPDHQCSGMDSLFAHCLRELTRCFQLNTQELGDHGAKVVWAGLGRCLQVGSGWLGATIRLTDLNVVVCFSGCLIKSPFFNAPAKSTGKQLRGLMLDRRLKLTARLGEVDLRIGEFRSLKTGDVLILNDKVTDKIHLCTGGGEVVCRGSLGKLGVHKAVQVSSQ